jgi:hypothetical protein
VAFGRPGQRNGGFSVACVAIEIWLSQIVSLFIEEARSDRIAERLREDAAVVTW